MIKMPNRMFSNSYLSGKYDLEKTLSKYSKILISKPYLIYCEFWESRRSVYSVQDFHYISIEVLNIMFIFRIISNTVCQILRHNGIWCLIVMLLIPIGHTKSGYHYFLFLILSNTYSLFLFAIQVIYLLCKALYSPQLKNTTLQLYL